MGIRATLFGLHLCRGYQTIAGAISGEAASKCREERFICFLSSSTGGFLDPLEQ